MNILRISAIFNRWWQHWVEYVNQDQSNNLNDTFSLSDHYELVDSSALKRPAGIDNSGLIYDAASEDTNPVIEIHDTLLEGRDYILLPQEVWNQLHTWYDNFQHSASKGFVPQFPTFFVGSNCH